MNDNINTFLKEDIPPSEQTDSVIDTKIDTSSAELTDTTSTESTDTTNYRSSGEVSLNELADYDIIDYCGPISKQGYLSLTNLIESKIQNSKKNSKLMLILTTNGGDPDAGYRIGRALNHYYDHVGIMIVDVCKSAGTLVAIAATELIIGDLGELGPLDIQHSKTDEMGEQSSSLNIFKTVNELQKATLDSFRHFVTDIRYGTGVSTKLAANIASNLTNSLISPISAQIDPIKLGEQRRALHIATEYAKRLNEKSDNLKADALERLISGYPCHSFVIDRKEASSLFKNVRGTNSETEELLYRFVRLYISKIDYAKLYFDEHALVSDFKEVIIQEHQNMPDDTQEQISSAKSEEQEPLEASK
ncbi:SppA protein [Vibrio parahaemolyticus]|nr:SppA protein [Vibrio parahaemolyticus]